MEISISWVFRDLLVGPQFSVLFPNPLCLGPASPSSPSGHCRGNAHTPASSVHNLSRRNSRFFSCAPHSCSPGREVYAQWGSGCCKHPDEKHGGGNPPGCWALGRRISKGGTCIPLPPSLSLEPGRGMGFLLLATLWAAFPFSI